jgi:hypothetical protein
MASRTFFLQHTDEARRHVDLLARGLKKVAYLGWTAGVGCAALALLVSHFMVTRPTEPTSVPGFQEISGILLVTWFMALALLVYSTLYFISGRGLARQQPWARYLGAGTFLTKVLLCVWLGRGSIRAMLVFLVIAVWDFYGLWVLLSSAAGQLFAAPESSQPGVKPAKLVT